MQTETEDGQVSLFAPDGASSKMCQVSSIQMKQQTSKSSSRRQRESAAIPFLSLDLTPGNGNLLGEFYWEILSPWRGNALTLNTGPAPPSGDAGCTLSQIMQAQVPPKYYLTKRACLGILCRAKERGKPLPPQLELALKMQAGLILLESLPTPPLSFHFDQRNKAIDLGNVAGPVLASANIQMKTFVSPQAGLPRAFHINQREEVIDLGETAGALLATVNMQMQTFVSQEHFANAANEPLAFAINQRKEVRDLRNVSAALTASQGMEMQTFISEKPIAAGFCAGAGAKAGSIGYTEELAPTLKASPSGNMMPSVLCLNDQGGRNMELSVECVGTLRAQEHGHQPLVFANHGLCD